MEKEILTREIIQKDGMRQALHGCRSTLLFVPILVLCYLVVALLTDSSAPIFAVARIFFLAMALFFVYLFIAMLVFYGRLYVRMKQGRFRIVTDRVVGMEEKQIYGRHNTAAMFNKPYRLHFACYGTYHVSYGKTHEWSKKFCLSDDGVYRYAHVDDEFYLVTTDGKTILEAYNKRLFELAEEQ